MSAAIPTPVTTPKMARFTGSPARSSPYSKLSIFSRSFTSPVDYITIGDSDSEPGTPISPISPITVDESRRPVRYSSLSPFKKTPSFNDDDLKIVTIIVNPGPNEKKFPVHRSFLVHASPYFEKAFNGPWMESQTGELKLQETSESAFGHVVNWIYTKQFANLDEELDARELTELWLLADKLILPKLCNQAMDALQQLDFLPTYFCEMIYHSTSTDSPLRKIFVDHEVSRIKYIEHYNQYPKEMLGDMFNSLRDFKENKSPKTQKLYGAAAIAAAKKAEKDSKKYHVSEEVAEFR